MPDKIYGAEAKVISQYESADDKSGINAKGKFKSWKKMIADQCKGNHIMTFALFSAFAPPLVKILKTETFGFHFFGASSRGKTTLLQIAASVWGNGAFSSTDGNNRYLTSWNSTANAFELVAASRNDLPLIIDELGQFSSLDFSKVIYNLSSGEGKARMTKDSKMRLKYVWNSIILSSGEISVMEKLAADKKSLKTGQLVRFLDIPINDGIVLDSHGMASEDFIKSLKKACSEHYGHAGREFLEVLTNDLKNEHKETISILQEIYDECKVALYVPDMASERERVIDRFALVYAAGHAARDILELYFSDEEIMESVKYVFEAWVAENNTLSDVDRAIENIKETIENNAGLFVSDFLDTRSNKKGFRFYDGDLDLYLFTKAQFKEVILGANSTAVAQKLQNSGLLHTNNSDNGRLKLQARLKIDGADKQHSYYAVKADILGPPEPVAMRRPKPMPDHDDEPTWPIRKRSVKEAMLRHSDFSQNRGRFPRRAVL